MCRWGCAEFNSTFMCKWCGTRYCRECLKGEYTGLMKDSTTCAKCHQKKCQGQRVEAVLKEYLNNDENSGKKGAKSAGGSRAAASAKRGKSAGKKKSGKSVKSKSGKKKGGSLSEVNTRAQLSAYCMARRKNPSNIFAIVVMATLSCRQRISLRDLLAHLRLSDKTLLVPCIPRRSFTRAQISVRAGITKELTLGAEVAIAGSPSWVKASPTIQTKITGNLVALVFVRINVGVIMKVVPRIFANYRWCHF
ncbi:hypothetical protein PoB_000339200 [Plakobranchus ocellatus]|uniref:Uncharacterized protein n=1 Tax=Plakobranchus ocellatus TaxID=259542 RepID=A0AAV3Y360_9GAST|nr:hypothetical protein PoB_000339200 [Plakobranchus ocellatus]